MKTVTKIMASTLLALLAAPAFIHAQTSTQIKKMETKKILIVVTSAATVPTNGKPTGVWLEEFATPYYFFKEQGFDITVASPKGEVAPIDPKSFLPDYATENVKRFLNDQDAQNVLKHTITLDAVKAADYDAVYYPGGTGPVWDLPDNAHSIHLLESFYNTGKPTALVCHGPAALKNVKDTNGELLVKGKKIAGYSNSEEVAGQSGDMVPFSLETTLKNEGAIYVKGTDWQSFSVSEANLITGQNPASSLAVARILAGQLSANKK